MVLTKKQKIMKPMTCDNNELEVAEILLQLPQLIAQERNDRDSHFPSSWGGKRTQYEIGSPSTPSTLLGPGSCNGNTSASPLSSLASKSDSKRKKMTKQELLQNALQVSENIRKLKAKTSMTRQDHEMLRLTSSILKQMEIEVSSCVKQKEITLNSSPETITGPKEVPSQAPVQEEKREKGEDAGGVLGQGEAEVERLASGSVTSISCSSHEETKKVKGLLDTSVKTMVLPDLNLSMEPSSVKDFVDPDDKSEEAIAAHQWPPVKTTIQQR